MAVGILTHDGPQRNSTQAVLGLINTVVLETNFEGVALDFGRSLGCNINIVVLSHYERSALDTYIVEQTVNVVGAVAIGETFVETENIDILQSGGESGDAEQLQVVVSQNLVSCIGLISAPVNNVVPAVLNHGGSADTHIVEGRIQFVAGLLVRL